MKAATQWSRVVGQRLPRASSFIGATAWSARTANEKTYITTWKMIMPAAYCFHVWGPLFSRFSNQARTFGGVYFPSMIHARYLLTGIERTIGKRIAEIGRN